MDIPDRFRAEFASVSLDEMKETLATVKNLLDLHRPVDLIEAKLANAGWSPGIATWMVQQVVAYGGVPPLPSPPPPQPVAPPVPVAPTLSLDQQLKLHYGDSYRIARFTNRIGQVVCGLAMIVAANYVVILLIATFGYSPEGPQRIVGLALGLLATASIGLLIYSFGILISAFGKMLSANLDTAVYSCPRLEHDESVALVLENK